MSLNAIPGIDFASYPQIMAAPPVPTPADYFALTRILLVPSVWEEPFGRVAAEAMINAHSAARRQSRLAAAMSSAAISSTAAADACCRSPTG